MLKIIGIALSAIIALLSTTCAAISAYGIAPTPDGVAAGMITLIGIFAAVGWALITVRIALDDL